MNATYDVLVVGGGVVGLTAAIAMSQRNLSVGIIDSGSLAAATNESGLSRVYAMNQSSRTLLENLSIWQHIESSNISPYSRMYVWDAVTKAHIEFDSRVIHSDRLGSIIDENSIREVLLSIAAASHIDLMANNTVTGVMSAKDAIEIKTSQGSWRTNLLMVADGANSKTRELLQVPITSWPYHQHAIVATVETELAHQQTAFQVFNPDGPLAFLPLPHPHQCSIVWSLPPAKAQMLLSLDEDQFNQQLTTAFAVKLGACKLVSPRSQFPLIMRHTQQYVGKRWLLLGDAAHSIHPLAGLGLNLGLSDISAYLSIVDREKRSPLSQPVLGAYQRQRKHAVWQVLWLMEGIKVLFANPLTPVATLRGLGLRLCNKLPLLKKFFIAQAAGDL